jgi:hypothetical protein
MANKNEMKMTIGVKWPDDEIEWKALMQEKTRREKLSGVQVQNSSLVRALVRERIEEIGKGQA